MVAVWNYGNNNILLNFVVDKSSWLESKEIVPNIQKRIGVHMELKTDDRILM